MYSFLYLNSVSTNHFLHGDTIMLQPAKKSRHLTYHKHARTTWIVEDPWYVRQQQVQQTLRHRTSEIGKKLAKFFHHNAISFYRVELDELVDLVKELCLAYYQQGMPGRFWMETTGVDLVYKDVHDEVEQYLQSCDALMANMDGWETEKKHYLKIVTETCMRVTIKMQKN